jgi:hypothetical protein
MPKKKKTDDIKDDIKKTADDLKKGAKKVAKGAEKEWDDLDLEKEALGGLKQVEKMLSSLSALVKEKREEWEEEGVQHTVKKDAGAAKKKLHDTTIEVLDDVEKAAKKLKKKLK